MAKFHLSHKRLAKVTPPWRGACFSIDDEHFDANGTPVDVKADLNDLEYAEVLKSNKGRYFKAAAKPEPPEPAQTPNNAPELTFEDVDLAAWGRGDIEVKMNLVKEAILDRYAVKATNRDKCLRVLVDEDIITLEEAGLDQPA